MIKKINQIFAKESSESFQILLSYFLSKIIAFSKETVLDFEFNSNLISFLMKNYEIIREMQLFNKDFDEEYYSTDLNQIIIKILKIWKKEFKKINLTNFQIMARKISK